MWISSRLHIFDKQSIEINLFKRLFINNYNNNKKNSFSTTIVAAVRGVRNEEERERNEETNTLGKFRVYEVNKPGRKSFVSRDRTKKPLFGGYERPARFKSMLLDQDWTNVWPTTSTFKHSAFPIPVRQGLVKNLIENKGLPPEKYANTELMKIPNFLHLTPPHVKKHCEAIKKFCTPWPIELGTYQDCEKYFPIEIKTTDYIYAGPSIRDERSRKVTLKIPLGCLNLNKRSRTKFIKLAGERYNEKHDILVLESERCPYRQQNYDYVKYLLEVLFNESWKVEGWEKEMNEEDWLNFNWKKSRSKENIDAFLSKMGESIENKEVNNKVNRYAESVTKMFDSPGRTNLKIYKESVLELLKLKKKAEETEKN